MPRKAETLPVDSDVPSNDGGSENDADAEVAPPKPPPAAVKVKASTKQLENLARARQIKLERARKTNLNKREEVVKQDQAWLEAEVERMVEERLKAAQPPPAPPKVQRKPRVAKAAPKKIRKRAPTPESEDSAYEEAPAQYEYDPYAGIC